MNGPCLYQHQLALDLWILGYSLYDNLLKDREKHELYKTQQFSILSCFRSCGSEDDFYLNWSVEKSRSSLHPPLRRQGSYQTGNSIDRGSHVTGISIDRDRMSVSSGDSTYDHPKTVLKVTSSPLALKRNPSSVSACSSSTSPLRRAMSERASSVTSQMSNTSDIRRMITATPCSCDGPGAGQHQQQQGGGGGGPGFENYDIPRNLGRQVGH